VIASVLLDDIGKLSSMEELRSFLESQPDREALRA